MHLLTECLFLFAQVCQTIQKEFGKNMDDLFSDFVEEPLATASVRTIQNLCRFCKSISLKVLLINEDIFYSLQIAQVHRATLINGQEVVVKVQHEGIKAIILEVLQALAFKMLG